jgi:hypothetical protein
MSDAVLPCHLATSVADVIRATCHPYSDDTCHPCIGPSVCQIIMPRVTSWTYHVLPSGVAMSAVWPYNLYSHHATWTVRTVQSSPFFAYFPFQTERNIFLIRNPFDEINIPPKSGRRDRRNGASFVAFRALSFLSILKPCQASGSDFGSHLPTKRPFGPQKVTD